MKKATKNGVLKTLANIMSTPGVVCKGLGVISYPQLKHFTINKVNNIIKKKERSCMEKQPNTPELAEEALTLMVGNKLTLGDSPISQVQLLHLLQKTPEKYVYKRPAKGGGQWDYVTGAYVKKVLNYVFGWMWDFQIIDKGVEGDCLWVQGRLTIKKPDGTPIVIKEQFGRADIKFKTTYNKETKTSTKTDQYLDYGNDLKAATTDALKKCASELGIASDIYGKEEFKEVRAELSMQVVDNANITSQANEPATENQIATVKLLAEKKGLEVELEGMTYAQAAEFINQVTK